MRIILNRDDIEEAINAYVKEKYLPYGDKRELVIVQGTKASASITFKQSEKLPGFDGPEQCEETDHDPEHDEQNNEGDLVDNSTSKASAPTFGIPTP